MHKIIFKVDFKLVKGYSKPAPSFERKLLECLLKICDKKAKEARLKSYLNEVVTNAWFKGYCTININDDIVRNSVKEAIRIADGKKSLLEHAENKYPDHYDFITAEARNFFGNKKATASMILCSHRFNYCSIREALINNNLKGNKCP